MSRVRRILKGESLPCGGRVADTSRSPIAPTVALDGVPAVARSVHACRSDWVGVVRAARAYRLVAVTRIAAGHRLFRIEGATTHRPSRYSVQIGETLHIDLGSGHSTEEMLDRYFWRFMNHGCDPNTVIRRRNVIALRDIAPWEEITFNYNTTEYDMAEPFACRCGHAACPGEIRGYRYLTATERERLRPFAAPHLKQHLRRQGRRRHCSAPERSTADVAAEAVPA